MSKWKQISGDVNWSDYGGIFAKVNKEHGSVDLVRIEPWIEHDSSAIPTHGLYVVDDGVFYYDDLGADKKNVLSAMKSMGMDVDEYKKLEPEYKAEILASYEGYGGESRSTSDLMNALPDKPENIEFWHGKETEESIRAANQEMRRAALDKLYDTSFDFGEMPDAEALNFAFGDESFEIDLDDNERAGFDYAMFVSGMKYKRNGNLVLDNLDDFKKVVTVLAEAPDGSELDLSERELERYRGYGLTQEEVEEGANEQSGNARELAVKMMEALGFTWR